MLALLIQQQDGDLHALQLGLDQVRQAVEHFCKLGAPGDQFQDMTLSGTDDGFLLQAVVLHSEPFCGDT
ncbi:hypothetical protein D3C84_1193230 [compost metagenome]